ncbi:hypothetical protein [Edaphocola aurantiacus]|uniref:hypothetical protein n=1 Tax=Edaphocola aurantiacus TaxID=2601682 RepID=UPI001C95CD5E|nr:hypothetical protein [Edaphocola aurantiacus]
MNFELDLSQFLSLNDEIEKDYEALEKTRNTFNIPIFSSIFRKLKRKFLRRKILNLTIKVRKNTDLTYKLLKKGIDKRDASRFKEIVSTSILHFNKFHDALIEINYLDNEKIESNALNTAKKLYVMKATLHKIVYSGIKSENDDSELKKGIIHLSQSTIDKRLNK